MDNLFASSLYGAGLFAVDNATLVSHYNDALTNLGVETTGLDRFRIDRRGWSPEIAVERGDKHYLAHGHANPLAVVVSPDQRGAALYAPIASFEGSLMAHYFERFAAAVADLTQSTAIGLDLDQKLSRYRDPADLLLIREVIVRSHAGPLSEAAETQSALIDEFEVGGWFDPELRRALLESAREHGDLRFRELAVPDMPFDGVHDFYADVFGGVFVLRAPSSGDDYLILCDQATYQADSERASAAMWLRDPELIEQLLAANFVELDLSWYQQHLEVLQELSESLTIGLLGADDPELDFGSVAAPERKRRLRKLGSVVPERLFELEQLSARLEGGDRVEGRELSLDLTRLLLRPHSALPALQRSVVAQLLLYLEPIDVQALFDTDRAHFFEAYRGWPEAKRRWAQQVLARRR